MKTKVFYTIAAIVIIVISIMVTGRLIMSKPVPKKNEQAKNLLNVKAQKVENKTYDSNIKYRGRILSYENISLSAEVNGKIMQGDVPFKSGQTFNKNDLLVRIYNDDVKAALMSGKSSFLRTISVILPDINIDFPDEYNKWLNFFNSIKVDSKLPKLPEMKTEQEQIYLASKGVLTEYYLLRQQEINLEKYTIYAPFDGTFKNVIREIGAVASMGVELASIIRTDKLEVIVPVLPGDAKWIKPNDPVKLIGSNQTENGKVSRIADYVDQSTQSINIYIDYYPKGNKSFLEGEFIDVEFNISKQVSGFKIPREAVNSDNEVYIIQDEKLQSKAITIERALEDYFIISGIKNGEILVTESLADISEGAQVVARI